VPRLLAGAIGIAIAAVACSSSSSHPPPLGACTPTDGVPCGSGPGGGGGTNPGDGGGSSSQDGGATGDAGTCGGADSLLQSTAECSACIVSGTSSVGGLDCCAADLACSATDCTNVVTCSRSCAVGDTACVGACEGLTSQAGIDAYQDFAQCLSQNCPTICPTLTPGTTGDF